MWRRGEWPYGSGVRILFCNSCGLRCKKQTLEPVWDTGVVDGAQCIFPAQRNSESMPQT